MKNETDTIHILPTEYFFKTRDVKTMKLNGTFSFEMIDPKQKKTRYFLMENN